MSWCASWPEAASSRSSSTSSRRSGWRSSPYAERRCALRVLPLVSRRDLLESLAVQLLRRDPDDLAGCLVSQRRCARATFELCALADDRTRPELADDLAVHDDLQDAVEDKV